MCFKDCNSLTNIIPVVSYTCNYQPRNDHRKIWIFFLVFMSKNFSFKNSFLNSKLFLIFYHVSFIIKKIHLFANHGLKLKFDVWKIMAWIQPRNRSSSLKKYDQWVCRYLNCFKISRNRQMLQGKHGLLF
jgi:hypothetical protein